MFAENNPFTPSFGRIPPYMAGRSELFSRLRSAFEGNGNDPLLQTVLVGARGTGKTATLAYACELAAGCGWISASTTCGDGMLDDLMQQSMTSASKLFDVEGKAKLKGISVGQLFGLEWEPVKEQPSNWRTTMSQLLDTLAQNETGLLLTVDEVRPNVPEMEQLVTIFQHFVRENRRVALLMAGLPHQVSQLVNSEAVSFLRRASRIQLGRINDFEIEDALRKTVEAGGKTIDDTALEQCVQAIGGFPYMMQLVGFRVWDASGESTSITPDDARRGIMAARHDLEQQVLIPTWASISNVDKQFCRAMLAGKRDSKAIAQHMGKKANYVSRYKLRLLEQGIIDQDPYGQLFFCLPFFEDFITDFERGRF